MFSDFVDDQLPKYAWVGAEGEAYEAKIDTDKRRGISVGELLGDGSSAADHTGVVTGRPSGRYVMRAIYRETPGIAFAIPASCSLSCHDVDRPMRR